MKSGEKIGIVKWLALAVAAGSLLGGCSREDLDARSEIRLGVRNTATRGAIDSSNLSEQAGSNIGIYGVKTSGHSSATGADWSSDPYTETGTGNGTLIMDNVRTTAIDAEDGTIYWGSKRYYYPVFDAAAGVKFCAYHPYDANGYSVTEPSTGQAPVLNFRLDGTQDVMYAEPAVGWRDKKTATNLLFRHVLTQLTFALNDPEDVFVGKTVTFLAIKNTYTTGKMNIETGDIADWGTPADLHVNGFDTPIVIPAGTKDAHLPLGSEIMLQAGQKSFAITIEIDGKIYDITVRPDRANASFEAGKRYAILLTFSDKEPVFVGATVEDWKEGGYGAADVW